MEIARGKAYVYTNAARWVRDVLLAAAGVPLAAAVAYGLIRAYRTYHPPRQPFRKEPEAYGLAPASVRIPTKSAGISLDAWLFHARRSAPLVIVGHGVGQHKGFTLPYISLLHGAGYNVLAFDLRNHGRSDLDRVFWQMSRRFTDDMEAAIVFARNYPALAGSAVALLTFSFSTFPAVYTLTRPSCRVDAIICDSGPARDVESLPDRFLEAGKLTLPRVFRGPILYPLLKAVYRRAVNTMLAVDWPPDLSSLGGKLLLVANEDDTVIPPEEVKGVADLCPGAELWVAPAAGHLMALRRRRKEYSDLMLNFLSRTLAGQRPVNSDSEDAQFHITPDWSLP